MNENEKVLKYHFQHDPYCKISDRDQVLNFHFLPTHKFPK